MNAGAYYVKVEGWSSRTGDYTVHASFEGSDDGGGGADAYCGDGDTINLGNRCDFYGANRYFEVESSGRGCLRRTGLTICSGDSMNWRTSGITLDRAVLEQGTLDLSMPNIKLLRLGFRRNESTSAAE